MKKLKELLYKDFLNIIDEETQINIISIQEYDMGSDLRYIKKPSEAVQLLAIGYYPHEIEYIKNPSKKVQLKAVQEDPSSIEYIKNPSEEVQLKAIQGDSFSIEYIKNPSEIVQFEAIKTINNWVYFMEFPYKKISSPKVISVLYKKAPEEFKEKIRFHKQYRSDAQIVLERIK